MMVASLRKYAGTANRICNRFLPAVNKDHHTLCNACRGKKCSADKLCGDCYDWSEEMWAKVSDYCIKLPAHREKKERKVKSCSSFSGFPYLSLNHCIIYLAHLVVQLCPPLPHVLTPIMLLMLCPCRSYWREFSFYLCFSISGEPSRKRKHECSGSSSSITKEMWEEFQIFGVLVPALIILHQIAKDLQFLLPVWIVVWLEEIAWLPRSIWPGKFCILVWPPQPSSLACPACTAHLSSPSWPALPASLALLSLNLHSVWPSLPILPAAAASSACSPSCSTDRHSMSSALKFWPCCLASVAHLACPASSWILSSQPSSLRVEMAILHISFWVWFISPFLLQVLFQLSFGHLG